MTCSKLRLLSFAKDSRDSTLWRKPSMYLMSGCTSLGMPPPYKSVLVKVYQNELKKDNHKKPSGGWVIRWRMIRGYLFEEARAASSLVFLRSVVVRLMAFGFVLASSRVMRSTARCACGSSGMVRAFFPAILLALLEMRLKIKNI